jgi:hypothetical protein
MSEWWPETREDEARMVMEDGTQGRQSVRDREIVSSLR